ncbi:hypothetical protein PpBr36_05286 [Pyricularia pennisetigena]|uniref:hypothetical protein n=1 Tax=Pyricularia pennisetigena TaxID=1578925 RepID=UPI0011522720|nr:hypothetical protein PpBr36_05286 [Pyricularia pennisetigena]TLS26622.1 hypothetical protein PpBr36_05286 [Pyricularia pennisetigena]
MDTIGKFLNRTKSYHKGIVRGEACGVDGSWRKIGWALFRDHELKELRDSLHARLASVNTLLIAAQQPSFKPGIIYLQPIYIYIYIYNNAIRHENNSPLTQQNTSPSALATTHVISETPLGGELSVKSETDSPQVLQTQDAGLDDALWEKKVDLAIITVRIEARH